MVRVLIAMDVGRLTRTFSVCAALAVAACALCAASSQAAVALSGTVPTHYTYQLKWSAQKRVLSGGGSISVVNRGPLPTDRVWLRLRPNAGERLETLSRLRGATVWERRAGGSMVLLKLPTPLAVDRSAQFSFDLKLKVSRENTSLGRSAGIDLFGDALPVVAVAGPRGIRIGAEPSYGEGSFNAVAKWVVRLTLPRGENALLSGHQVAVPERAGALVVSSAVDVRDFAFAIGNFSLVSERVGDARVEVVGPASLRRKLPDALRRAVNAFRKMEQWYGGYRLPRLKVVLGDLGFGGSEYPGLVFSTPDNATIAHEVAHQWFYGLVGNDQFNDPFLDESLTAFSEQRFHKSYRCDLARPVTGEHGLATGMSYWDRHPAAYENTIYRGGACALTVLQHDLGRDVFDKALRAYVTANANKIAGVDDFLVAIKNAAPTYDLARWEKLVGL